MNNAAAAGSALIGNLRQSSETAGCRLEAGWRMAGSSVSAELRPGPHAPDGDCALRSMAGAFVKDLGLVLDFGPESCAFLPPSTVAHQMLLAALARGLAGLVIPLS